MSVAKPLTNLTIVGILVGGSGVLELLCQILNRFLILFDHL